MKQKFRFKNSRNIGISYQSILADISASAPKKPYWSITSFQPSLYCDP